MPAGEQSNPLVGGDPASGALEAPPSLALPEPASSAVSTPASLLPVCGADGSPAPGVEPAPFEVPFAQPRAASNDPAPIRTAKPRMSSSACCSEPLASGAPSLMAASGAGMRGSGARDVVRGEGWAPRA